MKDASQEKTESRNSAFSRLLSRAVSVRAGFSDGISRIEEDVRARYSKLMKENDDALSAIAVSLNSRLQRWAHPGAKLKLEWTDPERSFSIGTPLAKVILSEGHFEGDVVRFGHGLQRSYLLALLQELAASDASGAPLLILGCEEPELYQHPPQARHLAEVLQTLSKANSQILVCTHSPLFISGEGFESVRMIRKNPETERSTISSVSYDGIAKRIAAAKGEPPKKPTGALAKMHQSLQPALNEMSFTARLILVEGLEDVGYMTAYLRLTNNWEEYRSLGCHIVATNGKAR